MRISANKGPHPDLSQTWTRRRCGESQILCAGGYDKIKDLCGKERALPWRWSLCSRKN